MSGQAVVTIKGKQWQCSVASTLAEQTTGLSGVSSIPANTGMLFDLGSLEFITVPVTSVTIDMSQMLFPIDVVFMDSNGMVLGVIYELYPGVNETFQSDMGIRYFLEMNAGESVGILPGDKAYIEISGAMASWITPVVTFAGLAMVGVMLTNMGKTIADAISGKPKESLSLYSPAAKPSKLASRFRKGNNELEFLPDSPEFLAYTIDDIGYRSKIDNAFMQAIARVREG